MAALELNGPRVRKGRTKIYNRLKNVRAEANHCRALIGLGLYLVLLRYHSFDYSPKIEKNTCELFVVCI